ncbi:MAG TPA: serine/threonine-protein kinase [Kofleriaceae bacterium]|jgi:serine/threonine-protein kinase|nr:serine/threonine-protein kinase [Kofleriaceae bacterium]
MVEVSGSALGKYTLLARLATGGMAEIFAAKRPEGDIVVVKRILPHYAENPQFVQMFLDEARVASRIRHPNVCQVFELGRIGKQYFIAMELLEGVTLARLISRIAKSGRGIDIPVALGIIVQACEGLHAAHELKGFDRRPARLVHRDISPQNLFVTIDGIAKVLDFGIAKTQTNQARTRTGALKGKSSYMSPEQVRGDVLDRRSDVFSLAAVCYETLTCRRLFTRDSQYETYSAIVSATIPELTSVRVDVPSAVSRAVLGGLARTLGNRHASCQAFAQALKAAASADGIASRSTIKSTMERLFGTEIESQRQRLNDARPELSMSEIAIAKRPRQGEISQLPGILLDDLGDVGATLLDDLAPIDLAPPDDKNAAALEDKTPLDARRPGPVPDSISRARTPVPDVTPVASVRQAIRSVALAEPPPETPPSFGLWLAIGIAAVVLSAIVLLVIWVSSHSVEIEVLDPSPAPAVVHDPGPTREEPSPAALDTALPAAVDAGVYSNPARR